MHSWRGISSGLSDVVSATSTAGQWLHAAFPARVRNILASRVNSSFTLHFTKKIGAAGLTAPVIQDSPLCMMNAM
jgi:hypothetical protein